VAGLPRMAGEQLDLAGLAGAKLDRREAIREARKCCKRLLACCAPPGPASARRSTVA